MVWATGGFGESTAWHRSVWESHAGGSYRALAAETRARLGANDVVLQDVSVGTRTIATAFVAVGSAVSFCFHTCAEGNRADLRGVLESFAVSPRAP